MPDHSTPKISRLLKPKLNAAVQKILPYGIIWMIGGIIYAIVEKGILGSLAAYPTTQTPYIFSNMFKNAMITGLVGGLMVGSLEVLWFNRRFRYFSFGQRLFFKTLLYLGITIILLVFSSILINSLALEMYFWHEGVLLNVTTFFTSFAFWSVLIYIGFFSVVCQFYSEVSDNLGANVLLNFFTGKYRKSVEEQRIFMFLDLKGSTAMAEKLGHVKYFELLYKYYADMSDAITATWGEIYQYVGDEIVVSWQLERGLEDFNCLRCFFMIKDRIHELSETYQKEFSIIPSFKAGIHCGNVSTGEIGVTKKDILFTGDVLNTTSRIQSECNNFQTDLLISSDLLNSLDPSVTELFCVCEMGHFRLRGKNEEIQLFHIGKAVEEQPIDSLHALG